MKKTIYPARSAEGRGRNGHFRPHEIIVRASGPRAPLVEITAYSNRPGAQPAVGLWLDSAAARELAEAILETTA